MVNWRPPEGHPAHPGEIARNNPDLSQPFPGVIESEVRYPGLPDTGTKRRAAEHYRVQGNAARWELYGEKLQQELRELITTIEAHENNPDRCEACLDRAASARTLLNSIG